MNGAHDLGGMQSFGPVEIEPAEPVFHHDWERRAFALTIASGFLGAWTIDESRFAREQMPPAKYLASTYYELWLFGLEAMLDKRGFVARSELDARLVDPAAAVAPVSEARALAADDVGQALRTSRSARMDDDVEALFAVGDEVRTVTIHPVGHTRLPRYARGKHGVVVADHGVWVFADAAGTGLGRQPQHCYSVRFEARELWGDGAPERDAVYLDLWDNHLEAT